MRKFNEKEIELIANEIKQDKYKTFEIDFNSFDNGNVLKKDYLEKRENPNFNINEFMDDFINRECNGFNARLENAISSAINAHRIELDIKNPAYFWSINADYCVETFSEYCEFKLKE